MASISAAVFMLTQIVKWASWFPTAFAPLAVMLLSAGGVGLWVFANPNEVGVYRLHAFDYAAAWVMITGTAASVYGFASKTVEAFTGTGTGAGK